MNQRPVYETDADWQNQGDAKNKIELAFNCQIKTLKRFYPVDLCAMRKGEAVAWIEFKRRKVPRETYPDLILSLDKVMQMANFQAWTEVPAFLIVQWDNGLFYHKIQKPKAYRIGFGGRTDRNDPEDVEPVCHIPIDQFVGIATGEN